jgi:hypothetical protein
VFVTSPGGGLVRDYRQVSQIEYQSKIAKDLSSHHGWINLLCLRHILGFKVGEAESCFATRSCNAMVLADSTKTKGGCPKRRAAPFAFKETVIQ